MATRRKTQDELYAEIKRDNEAFLEERAYREWAAWRDAEHDAMLARRRQRGRAAQQSGGGWQIVLVLAFIPCAIAFVLWLAPEILTSTAQAPAQPQATIAPQPTLDAVALENARLKALLTAAEQQTLNNAIPTPDTSQPPQLPAQATATAITQPSVLDDVPARSLSPVDPSWRPVATPTTMLSPEQYEASQASEEQNFINNELQNLTNAQQLVKVHEAEQNAQGQP